MSNAVQCDTMMYQDDFFYGLDPEDFDCFDEFTSSEEELIARKAGRNKRERMIKQKRKEAKIREYIKQNPYKIGYLSGEEGKIKLYNRSKAKKFWKAQANKSIRKSNQCSQNGGYRKEFEYVWSIY